MMLQIENLNLLFLFTFFFLTRIIICVWIIEVKSQVFNGHGIEIKGDFRENFGVIFKDPKASFLLRLKIEFLIGKRFFIGEDLVDLGLDCF